MVTLRNVLRGQSECIHSHVYTKQKIAFFSQFDSIICITEIVSKKCYFLLLGKRNTATTNEGTQIWITYEASYFEEDLAFRKLNTR